MVTVQPGEKQSWTGLLMEEDSVWLLLPLIGGNK